MRRCQQNNFSKYVLPLSATEVTIIYLPLGVSFKLIRLHVRVFVSFVVCVVVKIAEISEAAIAILKAMI